MIEISQKPRTVIKHYKVKVGTYNVSIIHNETTGDIQMTNFGMSTGSYNSCVNEVIETFKEQFGLDEKGKKYRVGNRGDEYGLITKYLGWLPEGKESWNDFTFPFSREKNQEISLVSPDGTKSVSIIMRQPIIKDAFALSFFGEERVKEWHLFCIVSTIDEPNEQFIIPLH